MPDRLTLSIFIERAKAIHGSKYDYSKVKYVNMHTHVTISCNIHGDFLMKPYSHIQGQGCPQCGIESRVTKRKMTTELFIKRAKETHGDKYDYSKVEYTNTHTKVCIICPIHGEFWQKPAEHLCGKGCYACGGTKKLTTEEFIEKAKEIHGDRYIYDKVVYDGNKTKVCIICREHGEFWITPNNHLKGGGCGKCADIQNARRKIRKAKNKFIEDCTKIHNNKYDYSKTIYKSADDYIDIICPKHGLFRQIAKVHKEGHGCPSCKRSLGEEKVSEFLNKNNFVFLQQYNIPNEYTFCNRKTLRVDFFIPNFNIIIEYNGLQHYTDIDYFGGEKRFLEQKERDTSLRQYCKEHNIKLIEISYKDYDNIEDILKKKLL